ncbi:MAG: hypothetical protein JO183_04790, partial [Ktedonobacteraceae bacterium]|nr:hypothetical protein [Ktedonobacteraceae bacterium]
SKQEEAIEEDKALEKFRQWCNEKREKLDQPDYTPSYKEKREACERLGIKAHVWREGYVNPQNGEPQRIKISASPTDIESIAS